MAIYSCKYCNQKFTKLPKFCTQCGKSTSTTSDITEKEKINKVFEVRNTEQKRKISYSDLNYKSQNIPISNLSSLTKDIEYTIVTISDHIHNLEKISKSIEGTNDEIENAVKNIEEDINMLIKNNSEIENINYLQKLDTEVDLIIKDQIKINNLQQEFLENSPKEISNVKNSLKSLQKEITALDHISTKIISSQSNIDLMEYHEKLKNFSEQIKNEIEKIKLIKIQNFEIEQQKINAEREAIRAEKAKRESIISFKVTSITSEKIVSNLFAYIGVMFIISGVIFGLTFSYVQFIQPFFPQDALFSIALTAILLLYLLSFIFSIFPPILLSKLTNSFSNTQSFFISIGVLISQFSLYLQAFYFENLNELDFIFPFLGLLLSSIFIIISLKINSQLLALNATQFLLWITYLTSFVRFSISNFNLTPFLVSLFYILSLFICILIMLKSKIWAPLILFDLISPILIYFSFINGDIFAPQFLLVIIPITNVYLKIKNLFPTPNSFSHFVTTTSLISPNLLAYFMIFSENYIFAYNNFWNSIYISIIFLSFFVLYWVYVILEKELNFSIKIPISISFKDSNVIVREYSRNLNWLMLVSFLIMLLVVIELLDQFAIFSVLLISVVMSLLVIISIKYKFEDLVTNSTILMLIEAQLFFFLINNNQQFMFEVINIPIILIYLAIFTSIFYFVDLYKPIIKLFNSQINLKLLNSLIIIITIFNYINLLQNPSYEVIFTSFAIIKFLIITEFVSRNINNQNFDSFFIYLISIGLYIIFIISGFYYSDSIQIDLGQALVTNIFNDLLTILPFICIQLYLYYIAFLGRNYYRNSETEKSINNLTPILDKNYIFVIPILMNLYPFAILSYFNSYFANQKDHQVIFSIFITIYFVSLPALVMISRYKKSSTFNTIFSLSSFYTLIFTSIVIGLFTQFVEFIINPNFLTSIPAPDTFLRPDLSLLLFIILITVTILWTLKLNISEMYFNLKEKHPQNNSGGLNK